MLVRFGNGKVTRKCETGLNQYKSFDTAERAQWYLETYKFKGKKFDIILCAKCDYFHIIKQ